MKRELGIDVSEWNGNLNFKKIKADGVEFAYVRAGYGKGKVDGKFHRNMKGFSKTKVKLGVYWFSYALNAKEAIEEANYLTKILEPYKDLIALPVAFDFEYDSEKNMRLKGITPNKRRNTDIVKAFCKQIKKNGYQVINYANVDYIKNHFYYSEISKYGLWLAEWGVKKPSYKCDIWQFSSKGKINGSSRYSDVNYIMNDLGKTSSKKNNKVVRSETKLKKIKKQKINNDAEYIVRKGDTLSKIASIFKMPYKKIAKDNNIKNPNIIRVGDKLRIKKEVK